MRTRIVLVTAGILIMGYAVAGALTDPDLAPAGVLLFLAAVLAGHDLILMPAALAVGAAISAFVPSRRRTAVTIVAISAAAIVLVALPLVLGPGRPADNPSVLPLPYGRNLALVLLVLAAGGLWWRGPLARRTADRRRRRAGRKDSERPRDDVA